MKKLLAILLVLALTFGMGGASVIGQPPPRQSVVLGQPIVADNEPQEFSLTVREDGYFRFVWAEGFSFRVQVWTLDWQMVHTMTMSSAGHTAARHLEAGQYIVRIVPRRFAQGVHGVTVTQTDAPYRSQFERSAQIIGTAMGIVLVMAFIALSAWIIYRVVVWLVNI